jgi:hypothetical protein
MKLRARSREDMDVVFEVIDKIVDHMADDIAARREKEMNAHKINAKKKKET